MGKYFLLKKKLYKLIDKDTLFKINRTKLNLSVINLKINLKKVEDYFSKKKLNKKNEQIINKKIDKKKIYKQKNDNDSNDLTINKYINSKLTDFNLRLLEKQKVRIIYGIYEKQFFNYYKIALKSKGNTAENFIKLLECRLDNIVYRIGFSLTRNQARQLIVHKLILVNNKIINIPSYQIKKNDIISLKTNSKLIITQAKKILTSMDKLNWLETNIEKLKSKVNYIPNKIDLPNDIKIKEQLIIEFYSK